MFYCVFHLWYVKNCCSYRLFFLIPHLFFQISCVVQANDLRPILSSKVSTYVQCCKCRLNILAELLRFGDREFYKDWWNAKTVEEVVLFLFFPLDSVFCYVYSPCWRETVNCCCFLHVSLGFTAVISIGKCGIWYVSCSK